MTCILAHRANITGPDPDRENRLPAVRAAFARGWGIETDIRRRADGQYYISHDACPEDRGVPADDFFALAREFPGPTIALNIKETGGEDDLLAYLDRQGATSRLFLFDMELIEPRPGEMARRFRALHPAVPIAARVSDRDEPLGRALAIEAATIIWLDEFDRFWCTADDVAALKQAGRRVCAVSPELHGFTLAQARERWLQLLAWGVDAICTDYPDELASASRAAGVGGCT